MTRGICPFATLITGIKTQEPGAPARVGFCDHVAAGYMETMRRPSFWNDEQGTSVHFAIGKAGEIIQFVYIFDTAWAQGRLGPRVTWQPYETMARETATGNPNAWLISTEHAGWPSEEWTPAMYESDLRLKRWCVAECRGAGMDLLRFGLDSLTGHYMFDGAARANCPGPHWPQARLFADLTAAPLKELTPALEEELADSRALALFLREVGAGRLRVVPIGEHGSTLTVEIRDGTRQPLASRPMFDITK